MKRSNDIESAVVRRASNVVPHKGSIRRVNHEATHGHRGAVVWLTGLPGSGKSTIADATQRNLHGQGIRTALLDGDNIRCGLCSDLGFSEADRNENVRRVAETAKLFLETGVVVIVALVSPIRETRERIKQMFSPADFIEVFCSCPSSICAERDPKGHYSRAKRGEIKQFTGISSAYEAPLHPSIQLDTGSLSASACIDSLSTLVFNSVCDQA